MSDASLDPCSVPPIRGACLAARTLALTCAVRLCLHAGPSQLLIAMLSLASASLGFAPAAFVAPVTPRAEVKMETAADVKQLAKELNPGARQRYQLRWLLRSFCTARKSSRRLRC